VSKSFLGAGVYAEMKNGSEGVATGEGDAIESETDTEDGRRGEGQADQKERVYIYLLIPQHAPEKRLCSCTPTLHISESKEGSP
jgi:hypothetical protein